MSRREEQGNSCKGLEASQVCGTCGSNGWHRGALRRTCTEAVRSPVAAEANEHQLRAGIRWELERQLCRLRSAIKADGELGKAEKEVQKVAKRLATKKK